MAKKFPLHPKHPERICWGCDRYCPTDALACGNGSDRTMHPVNTSRIRKTDPHKTASESRGATSGCNERVQ
ncbi:DUF3079 domain-containing protein [Achromobacter ruhlandii]|uniref:DUF3079 domain-containing protein n=1 Tax=Achromobacter ruhlandii TaxID=72557 RepID=UPI000A5CB0A8